MFLLKVVLLLSVYQNYCTGFPHDIDEEFQNVRKLQTIDNVITNDEIKTKDGEVSVTPGVNPTTENGRCPSDKSLFSTKDIMDIITQISTDLDIYKSMGHVVPEAEKINQEHLEDLKQFEGWLFDKPEHLIHVLEGLSAVRKQTIEPEIQKVSVILKDYPQAKEKFNEKQLNFDKLNEKLIKYQNICKLYTLKNHKKELNHVFKRSIPEESSHVCTSIADLKKQITEELKENLDIFLNKTKEKLFNENKTLTEEIEKFKTDLKEKALKEFGHTMYSVLNLEDQYQHLVQDMNATHTQSVMYDVKELGLQIDSKLFDLERLIEEYGNYCKNCIKGPAKRSVRHKKSIINVNQKSSIVHELIKQQSFVYEMDINKKINEIFKDLNESLNNPVRREAYLNNLKLKEKKIKEIEEEERLSLEHLKSIASPDSVKKLLDLASFSKDLLKNVNEKIELVKKITH